MHDRGGLLHFELRRGVEGGVHAGTLDTANHISTPHLQVGCLSWNTLSVQLNRGNLQEV